MKIIIAILLVSALLLIVCRYWFCSFLREMVIYAQDHLKADVVGLGALTASLTDGGKWLTKQNLRCKLTHGNTYATLIAEEGISQIIQELKLENPLIAIVGAYGVIGSALARMLAEKYRLLLIGKNNVALERLKKTLEGSIATTTDMDDLKNADIIITATSHPESLLQPHQLKHGAVVYDVSQPHNVGPEVTALRPDDGIEQNVTGEIDFDFMEQLREIGKRRGFTHADFTSFGKRVDVGKSFQLTTP